MCFWCSWLLYQFTFGSMAVYFLLLLIDGSVSFLDRSFVARWSILRLDQTQLLKKEIQGMYSVGNDLCRHFPCHPFLSTLKCREKKKRISPPRVQDRFEWSIIWRASVTASTIVYTRHPSQHWLLRIHFIWRGAEATCYRNWRWVKGKIELTPVVIKRKIIAMASDEWEEI